MSFFGIGNRTTYEQSNLLRQVGSTAVAVAQIENRQAGIPSPYYRNGRLYYELPSGDFTSRDPFDQSNQLGLLP